MILSQTSFRRPAGGWDWPPPQAVSEVTADGCVLAAAPGKRAAISGPGVHTRNGDSVELRFDVLSSGAGKLTFGLAGGFEHLLVVLDLKAGRARLETSECNRRQPVASAPVRLARGRTHTLRIDKAEGAGRLVKLADARVRLDGETILEARGLNVLDEIGVALSVAGARVLLRRFVHRGRPAAGAQALRVAAWQVLNRPDIDANLDSIRRGLRAAAERGVRLLVTPETSLTGLFPKHAVTRRRGPVADAEAKLRRFIRRLKDAPWLVAGLPVWTSDRPGGRAVRRNVSRVYDADGHVVLDAAKVHSCEEGFWHGLRLNEFEIDGVPACLHVCHDGRYPELWTLPVMFGSRLVIHPTNGGTVSGSLAGFRRDAGGATATMHAFYVRASGGGGSCIVGPGKYNNVLAVSDECRADNPASPLLGPPVECLVCADVRIADAFGYWPARSFRVSEAAAAAYTQLYRALGGRRNAKSHDQV